MWWWRTMMGYETPQVVRYETLVTTLLKQSLLFPLLKQSPFDSFFLKQSCHYPFFHNLIYPDLIQSNQKSCIAPFSFMFKAHKLRFFFVFTKVLLVPMFSQSYVISSVVRQKNSSHSLICELYGIQIRNQE